MPTWQVLKTYLIISLILNILFIVVYGGMNLFNVSRETHHHWYMDWELSIPLIPGMVYVYLSVQALFLLPLFTLTQSELKILAKQLACAMIISALLFFLFPTVIGFSSDSALTAGNPGFDLVYLLDEPYNLFPSLHISLSALIVLSAFGKGRVNWKIFMGTWYVLLVASVLLTHQHHLLDIIGGWLVCWLAYTNCPYQSTSQGARG